MSLPVLRQISHEPFLALERLARDIMTGASPMTNFLLSRDDLERQESERLAPYAVAAAKRPLQREHAEEEHCYRTALHRDPGPHHPLCGVPAPGGEGRRCSWGKRATTTARA